MARAITAALLLLLSLSAHATLVAIVPSRDGLVVAADSRLTFMGRQCDGAFKILEPARPVRTLAVVTGDSEFVTPPPQGSGDVCGYLTEAPRLLDMRTVVSDALDRAGDDPARISTEEVSAACVRAVEQFQKAYPAVIQSYAGRNIFSVVIASYEPKEAVATIRRFAVRVDAGSFRVQVTGVTETKFDRTSSSDILVFGETGWVQRDVFSGPGRRFLDPATLDFLKQRRPVGEVSMNAAEAVAANFIRAASLQADIDPPPSGIGGEIRVMAIGRGPRPETLRSTMPY